MTKARITTKERMLFQAAPLESERLQIEPLRREHLPELCALIDPEIWRWYTIAINNEEDMQAYVERHMDFQEQGVSQTYVVRLKDSDEVVGSTRYIDIDRANRRLEVGSTWYAPRWQRTFVNTECKLVFLGNAFENLQCIAVQLQTDELNERSRRAMERLGAKFEGITRNHRICEDGRLRNSAFYSITQEEWPATKVHLQGLLRKYSSSPT